MYIAINKNGKPFHAYNAFIYSVVTDGKIIDIICSDGHVIRYSGRKFSVDIVAIVPFALVDMGYIVSM